MSLFQKLSTVLTKLSIENPWYKGKNEKSADNIPTFGLPSIDTTQLDIGDVRDGNLAYTNDSGALYLRQNGAWKNITAGGAGTGDVVGPEGGVQNGDIVIFNGVTGKLIMSSGKKIDIYGNIVANID